MINIKITPDTFNFKKVPNKSESEIEEQRLTKM